MYFAPFLSEQKKRNQKLKSTSSKSFFLPGQSHLPFIYLLSNLQKLMVVFFLGFFFFWIWIWTRAWVMLSNANGVNHWNFREEKTEMLAIYSTLLQFLVFCVLCVWCAGLRHLSLPKTYNTNIRPRAFLLFFLNQFLLIEGKIEKE